MTEQDSSVPGEAGGNRSDPDPVDSLPSPVRSVVISWAADALSGLLPLQIPTSLTRVARFTPGKRARLGATVLAQAVQSDASFRAAVAERARRVESAGVTDDDAATAAALAYLLRLPSEASLMESVRDSTAEPGSEVAELRAQLRRAIRRGDLLAAARPDGPADASDRGPSESDKLRLRLREQGTRLRNAELAAEVAGRQNEAQIAALTGQVQELSRAVELWQNRTRAAAEKAERAQDSLGRLRDQARLHRSTSDRRLDLLLSTVEGAVTGLRREWDLSGGGDDPADVVAGRLSGGAAPAESTGDPARLNSWLGLPAAHLIVDGYNVTKTGYPQLALAQQRERLVTSLSALSARTSADVTVVFDGAAVAVPAPPGRGIRVLFSPAGVIADDVIRDLVAAEPGGRVVVVVTSDRELSDGVRRRGARTAGSSVLLTLVT